MIGKIISNYRIEKIISQTGISDIYLGVHQHLDKKAAIKILKPEILQIPGIREKLISGSIELLKIYHPNIAQLLDFNEDFDALIFEYIEGHLLDYNLSRKMNEFFDIPQKLKILEQIISGILYAHNKGMIHTAINPSNIILTDNYSVKLLNLGISNLLGHDQIHYGITKLMYLSPEQTEGHPPSKYSDIYSIGILAYSLFSDQYPYPLSWDREAIINSILNKPFSDFLKGSTNLPSQDIYIMGRKIRDFINITTHKIPYERKLTTEQNTILFGDLNRTNSESGNETRPSSMVKGFKKCENGHYYSENLKGCPYCVSQDKDAGPFNTRPDFSNTVLSAPAPELSVSQEKIKYKNRQAIQADNKQSENRTSHSEIGKIDYAIPTLMSVKKTERCIVRIAKQDLPKTMIKISEDSIGENIRISDLMSVYLIDPSDNQNFHISSLSTTEQLIKSGEYTEWLFDVTPLKAGKFKLCLKVTITEISEKLGDRKKDVNVLDREIEVQTNETLFRRIITNKYAVGITAIALFSVLVFLAFKLNIIHIDGNKESFFPEIPAKLSNPTLNSRGLTIIADSTTKDTFQIGKYYAFIIAVQDYLHSNVIDLNKPVSDAAAMENVLLTDYIFERENVIFKKNPTRDTIIKTFQFLEKVITPDDYLLIFYAGHGQFDRNKDQGYWLPSDADYEDPSRWINNQEVKDYLKSIKARHILLIVDACFAGNIFRSLDDPDVINTMDKLTLIKLKSKSRKAITSGYIEEVPDKSIFLEYLVNSLKLNPKTYLTGGDLYFLTIHSLEDNYIRQHPEKKFENPQYGKVGDDIDQGGEFIFIRRWK